MIKTKRRTMAELVKGKKWAARKRDDIRVLDILTIMRLAELPGTLRA